MSKVALCVDVESIQRPELIGLAGESLAAQPWLELLDHADEARGVLSEAADVAEVWVASCAEMEPVNLAAALKLDHPDRPVVLVSEEPGGSVRSCAAKARIDEVIDQVELAKRYAFRKSQRSVEAAARLIDSYPAFFSASAKDQSGMGGGLEDESAEVGAGKAAAAHSQEAPELEIPRGIPASDAPALPRKDYSGLDRMPAGSRAFLLPVLSGSGGAGKSTVAVVAALLMQRAGLQTLLVDFDLQFGDAHTMLGVKDSASLDDVVRSPLRLQQLAPRGQMPALLKPPARLEDAELLVDRASEVLDLVQGRFDVIVANTGAFWAETHAQLLERSSKALFLIDQRPSSLRACKRALDLCSRCGIAASPFVFVPNRCGKGALYTSIDVSCAMQGADSYELADGGSDVEELLAEGQCLELISSGNALVQSVDQMLRQLVPAYEEAMVRAEEGKARRSIWRRLGFGRKKAERRVQEDVPERESA